ncbi:MAG: hypothetical protein K2Y03_05090 [Sphingomonas sp.]|nr:hypothetical protein [Sphingomonas sp.]
MMMRRLNLSALCIALSASASVHAQNAVATPQADIVVTGERLSREEARQQAAAYVRHVGVTASQQGVARWIDPVCPKVRGIDDKLAHYVEGRIRRIASAAGAPLAKDRCEPNLIVSFVADASAAAQFVVRRQPGQLAEVQAQDRHALLNGDAPVRWWYSTEIRGKDGDRLSGAPPVFASIQGGVPGQSLPSNGDTTYLSQYSNGIISTQTARAIIAATVVVDVNRAAGVRLESIAEYAAFVSLAEIRPTRDVQRSSILALFSGADKARQLTDLDSRFLQALYQLPLDRYSRQQRGLLIAALAPPDR